ncbi:hypothetical protein GCM10010251_76590 [Streptomyces aurantiogriseus]|uniref:Uncharacterized protein n=1 Tax=Streptomyces aurantiogriseus TaxID=66870 RepID=A0A918KYF5_9ACTN|nr:hypothetical protein GCM10010251_76590 [Streptomyces aurantiogriseus]
MSGPEFYAQDASARASWRLAVVEGDSLPILRSDVAEMLQACERGDLTEARDSAAFSWRTSTLCWPATRLR